MKNNGIAEDDERDEWEYYDPLLDEINIKFIVEDDDIEETLRSQEKLQAVGRDNKGFHQRGTSDAGGPG